jgi:fatty acid-binding protein DegV
MLSIKPVVTVREGRVEPAAKVRTRSKALQYLLDRVPVGQVEQVSVLHANAPEVDELLAKLEPLVGDAEVVVGKVGPVVGVHTGPRTVGIAWIQRA